MKKSLIYLISASFFYGKKFWTVQMDTPFFNQHASKALIKSSCTIFLSKKKKSQKGVKKKEHIVIIMAL